MLKFPVEILFRKKSRDSAFQIIHSYDTHDPAQFLEQGKMNPCITLFLLWKMTIYSCFSIPLWNYKFTKRLSLISQQTFIFLKAIVEEPCQNRQFNYSLLIRWPLCWLFFHIPYLSTYPITLLSQFLQICMVQKLNLQIFCVEFF